LTLIELIHLSFIASLCCLILHAATHEGMVLFFIRQLCEMGLPVYIQKPLYHCLICMCSIWGTAVYLFKAPSFDWMDLLFTVLITGGFNTIYTALTQKLFTHDLPADV
jgi:hypothetical protein